MRTERTMRQDLKRKWGRKAIDKKNNSPSKRKLQERKEVPSQHDVELHTCIIHRSQKHLEEIKKHLDVLTKSSRSFFISSLSFLALMRTEKTADVR